MLLTSANATATNSSIMMEVTDYLANWRMWRGGLFVLIGCLLRAGSFFVLFFLCCVAERAFSQRLQYAKHFCYLTSSRRARKYDLPHFRLNKARNIKVWLSLRSYLRKRGPQRSTNSVIASVFYTFIAICCLMCIQLLQAPRQFLQQMGNWDLLVLTAGLSIFLLQFITLGTKINKKFRNLSVLITEQ
uniref:DUF2721 domain-containing protein n=2 Tax=Macrostomum lignano TaxID=282301 RepID=A0A1I8IFD1_9PLAT